MPHRLMACAEDDKQLDVVTTAQFAVGARERRSAAAQVNVRRDEAGELAGGDTTPSELPAAARCPSSIAASSAGSSG
jgi:hypothetical protein